MKKMIFLILLTCLTLISCKNNKNQIIKNIKWLGNCTILIENDKTIYIDPVRLNDGLKKADLVLITHPHRDHFTMHALNKILKEDTKIVTIQSCAMLIQTKVDNEITIVKPGDKVYIDDIKIEVVPSYQFSENSGHSKSMGFVGYILEINNVRMYHTGDLGYIPEVIKNIKDITVCFFALGEGLMLNKEQLEIIKIINPDILIPMQFSGKPDEIKYIQKSIKNKLIILPKEENNIS